VPIATGKGSEVDALVVGAGFAGLYQLHRVAEGTLYRHAYKANSWYTQVNGPGKKSVFMPYAGGVGTFETVLEDVAADGYRGFHFSRAGGARALASHPQASA
jgi:hypothetical protein